MSFSGDFEDFFRSVPKYPYRNVYIYTFDSLDSIDSFIAASKDFLSENWKESFAGISKVSLKTSLKMALKATLGKFLKTPFK